MTSSRDSGRHATDDSEGPRRYLYRPDIIAQLLVHGVRPRQTTPPAIVREFIADLYRHELRRLSARVRRRELPHQELAANVIELRRRYPLVSIPIQEWTLPPETAPPDSSLADG